MIVAGSRDGRKGLGLRFDIVREMDETELEEGEACSFINNDDSTIDPDVALSYIDEKLQHVLGHFQKDFEGGVSAENLGAKFGGYGSFLPAYQRSPVWSHPRSPPEVYNRPKFSELLHSEGGCNSSTDLSSAPLSGRPGSVSVTAASVPALRASYRDDSVKGDKCTSTTCADGLTLLDEPLNISVNPLDKKSLKVRIKGGSGNLSTQKNAEIYCGLGLGVSPSSSMDDSPTDSEGFFHEPLHVSDESPTSILQIMTSFPVDGSILLSPLPDDLIQVTESEKPPRESKIEPVNNEALQKSSILVNGFDFVRGDRKVLGEKNPISSDKNAFSMELKGNGYDAQNGIDVLLKKEIDIDTSACDELVSNALNLPLLSKLNSDAVDSERHSARAVDISRMATKGGLKDEPSYNLAKEERLEPISAQEIGQLEKPNGMVGPAGKAWEVKRPLDDNFVQPRKEGKSKREKSDISTKADLNVSKGREALDAELRDPPKEKAAQIATSHNENGTKLPSGKEHSSYMGKRISKESQSHGAQEAKVTKNSSNVDSSVVLKNRKSGDAKINMSKSEKEDFKKGSGKATDRYRDFFGDLELEGEFEIASEKMPSTNRPKDFEVVGKNSFKFNGTSKERPNGKILNQPSTSEALPMVASKVTTVAGNGHIPDAAPAIVNPLVQEYWVCCDQCQTWRLLPLGTNPDSLPEKWVCSMLNWLPGMNRCSISEQETTKALRALYQPSAAALECQSSLHDHPGKFVSGASSIDVQHLERNHRHTVLHSKPSSGKKKDRFKDGTDAVDQDGHSNSLRKNVHVPVNNRSLNGMNQSPFMDELGFQHLGRSSNIVEEKDGLKKKEKNKIPASYSDGGDKKNTKVRNKRETDSSRPSKKAKMDDVCCNNEDSWSDRGGGNLKMGHSVNSDVSLNSSAKLRPKYHGISKDSSCDAKVNLSVRAKNPEEWIQINSNNQSLHTGHFYDDVKKRKVSECQGTQSYGVSAPRAGHHLQECRIFMEETCENDHRKEKKTKMSCSEGKETTGSKVNCESVKKGKNMKDQQVGPDLGGTLSQRSMDVLDSLKRDLGSAQPSMPATSSSSKVSGSHKNKSSVQVKGSPVESVSSSPLRISSLDKFTSTRTSLVGRDDTQDADYFAIASPRRCSDVEDGDRGSDRSGTARRDDTFNVRNHGSLESSVLDLQDRDLGCVSASKAKADIVSFHDFAVRRATDGDDNPLHQGNQYHCMPQASDHCHNEERENNNTYHANGSYLKKSAKGSLSSRSKEKNHISRSEIKKGKVRTSDLVNASNDCSPFHRENLNGSRNKFQEKSGVSSDKVEKNFVSEKDSARKVSSDAGKKESQSKFAGNDDLDVKLDSSKWDAKQNLVVDCNNERSSKRPLSDNKDCIEVSGMGKFHSSPSSAKMQNEMVTYPESISGSQKENGQNNSLVDTPEGSSALKLPKQIKKVENQNGNKPINSRHIPNRNKVRELDAPSPDRRESSSQDAINVVKEAKDLKHMADRLKNSGSILESRGLYFRAALKFLHGASLFESSNSDGIKHGEMIQSMQLYSSTAKLCEFCAHEFEKSKDMAAAALAYKCMEVAYMRVIYSSHGISSRAQHELQTALPIVPPGESPCSSASDVDNLNNPTIVDKIAPAKGVSSPHVTGSQVISAQNRSSIFRLLNFAQNTNYAMEASRKSRIAFAAANQGLKETEHREDMSSVKRALDFNFQDVEELLRLVRLAMEAISH